MLLARRLVCVAAAAGYQAALDWELMSTVGVCRPQSLLAEGAARLVPPIPWRFFNGGKSGQRPKPALVIRQGGLQRYREPMGIPPISYPSGAQRLASRRPADATPALCRLEGRCRSELARWRCSTKPGF